jgi:hypothetical protein
MASPMPGKIQQHQKNQMVLSNNGNSKGNNNDTNNDNNNDTNNDTNKC